MFAEYVLLSKGPWVYDFIVRISYLLNVFDPLMDKILKILTRQEDPNPTEARAAQDFTGFSTTEVFWER